VAVNPAGTRVYVANAGPGASLGDTNYTGFKFNRGAT